MPSDVKEQPGPEPRPTSFRRLGDPNATQDVESRGGAATQPGTDAKADGGPEADEEAEPIETRMSVLTFLKIVTACSALYMATNPWFFFYDADKGEICPYTVICATTPLELALLTGSRMSAGILFASLTIAIFSKNYATRSYVHHSWLGAVLDFEPTHDVHTYFGYLTLISGYEHGLLHCARHIVAGSSELIYDTDNGRSGMVACLLLLPIVLPMKFEFFRTKMTFEVRKAMHMLFLLMLVAICFHSVVFRFVGSILIVWYILDRLYFTTKQTFLINHPVFEPVGKGTMVSFDLPEGYSFKAGSYIYVNSPTISRSEWHPFSIIEVPGLPPRAAFFAEAVGDWTQELFSLGLSQPRLPLWITAAQPSLMEKSIYFDNVVLVCTGAGITPAVSIIERFASRKNIHLMWMSRDGGIVALFEKTLKKVNSTVHLTGKPEENTKKALTRLFATSSGRVTPSFRKAAWSVIRSNAFAPKSQPRMDAMSEEGGGGEMKSATPDTSAGRAVVDETSASAKRVDLSQLRRRGSTRSMSKPANPVTLEFGRPNIGKYLSETFEKYTDMPVDASDVGASTSMAAAGRDGRRVPGRQGSVRLDESQKVSKEMLMKADHTAVGTGIKSARVGGVNANGDSKGPGSALPWLVLYCGANPRVEEAIAKTCDELRVNWQKEYFGAW